LDVVTIVRPFDVCAVLRAKLPLKNAVGFTDFLERLGDAVNDQIGMRVSGYKSISGDGYHLFAGFVKVVRGLFLRGQLKIRF